MFGGLCDWMILCSSRVLECFATSEAHNMLLYGDEMQRPLYDVTRHQLRLGLRLPFRAGQW